MPRGRISFVGILSVYGAVSCGLWLYKPNFDASILKSGKCNNRLVDAVVMVPKGTMLPLSSVNVEFDWELIRPALFSGLVLAGDGKVRMRRLKIYGDPDGVYHGRYQPPPGGSSILPISEVASVTAEECFVEMAKLVREELGRADPSFARAMNAMEEWGHAKYSVGLPFLGLEMSLFSFSFRFLVSNMLLPFDPTPATPLFFNTLYHPYAKGSDFVRGYPFGLRSGVNCAVSCGLWLNIPDFDASILKSRKRNDRLVDAVVTVPKGTMLTLSGVNVAFDWELIGPALFSGLILAGEGKVRHETVEDLWCGMCVKVVCDHLGYGIKSGMPYLQRGGDGETEQEIQMERTMVGTSLLEVVVPFFQSVRLPQFAVTAEECFVEMAKLVREELGRADPSFARAADAMEEWVRVWWST
ncbi:probable UDP-arabinopyranose mutase 5 [Nymphaea colorata]|nr:probable UDP-arabinopyranose mutase 5 [Nymphaea colorata]